MSKREDKWNELMLELRKSIVNYIEGKENKIKVLEDKIKELERENEELEKKLHDADADLIGIDK